MIYKTFTIRRAMKLPHIITLLLLSSNVVLCEEKNDKADILDMLSTKRKESLPDTDFRNIKKMLPDDIYERVTKSTHEAIESGAVGKVGYGFLMGYSSGFCLKKVSKVAAFIIGGVFVTIQALSYNGFLEVNYDKIRSDVEVRLICIAFS